MIPLLEDIHVSKIKLDHDQDATRRKRYVCPVSKSNNALL